LVNYLIKSILNEVATLNYFTQTMVENLGTKFSMRFVKKKVLNRFMVHLITAKVKA